MSLFNELKRSNVFRVGVMYAVIAWLLLQIADVVLGNIGAPAWVFQSILLVLLLGAPLALFFAWAFELTPEGLKREEDVDRTESVTHQTGRKLDRMLIVILVIAVSYFAIDKFSINPDTSPDAIATNSKHPAGKVDPESVQLTAAASAANSIAVLPFVNMSSDPEQEYFSDGISEELLNMLAKVPEFQVAGRTSSFAFKGQNADLRTIGKSLGVSSILEGSVRKGGERVRITAQLVNVADGYHLWSETYDRELTDIFKVQDEIAVAVVEQLRVTLLGTQDPSGAETQYEKADPLSASSDAYDAYLRGLEKLRLGGPEAYYEAAGFFEEAVSLAPASALAWANLAKAWARFAGVTSEGASQALARAREALGIAMDLDDSVPEAYTTQSYIAISYDWDWDLAEDALQKALALRAGDVEAKLRLADLYMTLGNVDEAVELTRVALAQDPLDPSLQRALAVDLIIAGELAESEAMYRRLLRDNDAAPAVHGMLSWNLSLQGRNDEALEVAKLETVKFLHYTALAIIHHLLGNQEAARRAQESLWEEYGDGAAYQQANIHAVWGEQDEAVAWLERAFEANDPGMSIIKSDPSMLSLREHPGYIAILERMKLAD